MSDIIAAFEVYEGITVTDDGTNHRYPTSNMTEGSATVFVGSIRRDLSAPNSLFFCCVADNSQRCSDYCCTDFPKID